MFLKKRTEEIDCKFCGSFQATLSYSQETADVFGDQLIEEFHDHAWWNHWYSNHYNCAKCGKWIPPQERDLLIAQEKSFKIHEGYNQDERPELLRMHTSCVEQLSL